MSARDQRAATAARFSSTPPAEPAGPDGSGDVEAYDFLARKIRGTYDLYPAHFRALAARCAEAAEEIGEVRVTRQDAIEAAVHLILTDESTARRWVAQLRTMARERR